MTDDIQIIVNDNGVPEKFGRIAAQLTGTLRGLTEKAVLYVQSEIPGYPSEPPGSIYDRTGTLGRVVTAAPGSGPVSSMGHVAIPLTRIESLGGSVRGVVGGRLDYIGWVIDEKSQARAHRGRWYTLQQVLRGAKGGIEKIYREGVLKLFK